MTRLLLTSLAVVEAALGVRSGWGDQPNPQLCRGDDDAADAGAGDHYPAAGGERSHLHPPAVELLCSHRRHRFNRCPVCDLCVPAGGNGCHDRPAAGSDCRRGAHGDLFAATRTALLQDVKEAGTGDGITTKTTASQHYCSSN